MQVSIRLFAGLRERAGTGARDLELPDGATLTDVWAALELGDEPPGLLYAVNKRYAAAETVLADGDEVALIPPVSGGDFRLSGEPLSLDAAVREVRSDAAGAIATFTGTVRNRSRDRDVQYLEYEAYEGMAEEMMAELAAELSGSARAVRDRDPPSRRAGRDRRAERRDRRLVTAPRRGARGLQGGDRHAERRRCRSGRRRSTRAARSGSDKGHSQRRFREYPESVSYDPYAPREAEEPPSYSPIKHPTTLRDILRKLWAPIAAIGFLFWKLKFLVLAIFKFKLFTVAGSMLISIAAYALFWGWQFAIGFVLLLLVHELGHVLEAKREGLPVSAPMFIPFLGAVIMLKELPDNAWNEAKIAIAGPILGGLGAAAVWGLGEYYDSELLVALAFTGFFLNLFNLAPISPLDGGRIVAAIHPAPLDRRAPRPARV